MVNRRTLLSIEKHALELCLLNQASLHVFSVHDRFDLLV